ncbi:condensation domain-containing protein [Actinomadura algeriensis]|uniref:Condensation domain-containing protein n=1 Tax=Actinomadura algeriensis TaxID=1679523 RepID=A0ABR9JTM0_9ACTN|nr:condensation domain-containing protein [Actinomadura algeriensis]MBE1533917.1 hypothetical protein [Actinomadura algeriensis]
MTGGAAGTGGARTAAEKRELLRRLLARKERDGQVSPLSYAQRSLWFLHHVEPGNPAYNVPLAWRVRTALDRAAFDWALGRLVARHPMLRTTYHDHGGGTVQVERPPDFPGTAVRLDEVDATGMDDAAFAALLTAETLRPFDLGRGPLLRLTLYERGDGRPVLLLVAHHIAMDAWSIFVLLDELGVLYAARLRGERPSLPAATARYTEYVRREAELLAGPDGERLTGYWTARMAGAPPVLDLPADLPRPRTRRYRGDRCGIDLDAELSARLRTFAEASGTTLFVVLLAGFHALLSRYTGRTDVRVATPVAHREHAAFAQTVGYFADSVVLRADLSAEPSFRTLVGRVRDDVLAALDHQGLPFAALVEALNPPRDPGRPVLCEVGFGMQKSHRLRFRRLDDAGTGASLFGLASSGAALALDVGGIVLESYGVMHPVSRYDLDLQLHDDGGVISGALTYDSDLFERATAERLAGQLRTLLGAAVADPDLPVPLLPLVPADERRLLLSWGDG